jgi:hypothetical protein
MRENRHPIAALLLVTAALCVPAAASAQQDEPDRNVTVQDRPRPDYDPLGIRAGSFFFYPSVGLQGLYDSNIFATDDEEDDFASILTPRIQVKSNFSRHSLAFDVGGESAFYLDENDNNYNDVYARGAGQLEITRNNLLNGNIAVSRLHEDRDSPDESGADEITEYQNHLLGLSYRRNFARVFGILGGELRRFDFEDTDDINNDDRDRSQYLARARVGYEVSPRLDGFVEGTVDARRYDETPDDIGRDRDSEGYSLRAGADIDISGIVFGELSAGYSRRKYEDDELDTVNGLSFGGAMTWNVTQLTSVVFEALGELQETTVNFEGEEATANFQKSFSVDVTHELLRNVLLNANAAYIRDDFEGTDRADDSLLLGTGVSYLLNRNLSLDATYSFRTRDSDSDEAEYTRNIIRLGLTAKL